jgi:hypothetical protein
LIADQSLAARIQVLVVLRHFRIKARSNSLVVQWSGDHALNAWSSAVNQLRRNISVKNYFTAACAASVAALSYPTVGPSSTQASL